MLACHTGHKVTDGSRPPFNNAVASLKRTGEVPELEKEPPKEEYETAEDGGSVAESLLIRCSFLFLVLAEELRQVLRLCSHRSMTFTSGLPNHSSG
ncbi:hypothetical protein EW146_g9129 [Bondarzewia mesenterica]|uniref:Uncharacterized protein n=1 Tax=Bondarzewia mesenterica TaxID=1095465 RepID=A0A4S4LAB2_9AGAM|nr:hypothetical protein EW146_g9129 [Bondarzewia mesenterica]